MLLCLYQINKRRKLMPGKKLQETFNNYKVGRKNLKQTENALLEIIFRERAYFKLEFIDEDIFSEYLIYLLGYMESILLNFKSGERNFATYFSQMIQTNYKWWKYSSKIKNERLFCLKSIYEEEREEQEDNFNENIEEILFDEKNIEEKEQKLRKKDAIQFFENNILTYTPRTPKLESSKKRLLKDFYLFLALKSCNTISEEMIENIAEIVEIPVSVLKNYIDEAKASIEPKKIKRKDIENRRNFAYFQKRKFMQRKQFYEEAFMEKYIDDNKLEANERRWKSCINQLKNTDEVLAPSNIVIAKILGIPAKRITYVLGKISENIDNKKSKCYSSSHENLFSHWKSKQKTGDE